MKRREKSRMTETEYLLNSPANARRLLAALKRARAGIGRQMTLEEMRKESGVHRSGR